MNLFLASLPPFEVSDYQQVLAPTIVGKSKCTGLLPPLQGPPGIEGSSDLARSYDGSYRGLFR